jgi:hypothetical protein
MNKEKKFILRTNSNHPGQVTAYPALMPVSPIRSRQTLLKHEICEISRQIEVVDSWVLGFKMGVVI